VDSEMPKTCDASLAMPTKYRNFDQFGYLRLKDLFPSDFLEQPGAREIPVIIDGGQRNPQNLRYLLIAHPGEIPQFYQFGLNGIFEAEGVKHFVHGQQLVIRAWSSQLNPSISTRSKRPP